jgi:GLPGLI family protein
MKLKKITFYFLFFINTIYGQKSLYKIYVEFNIQKGQISDTEYLIASPKNSLYTTNFIDIDNEKNLVQKDENGNYTINEKKIKVNSLKYYATLTSNELYFVSTPPKNKKEIIAIDHLPDIEWRIKEKETKKINNFTSYKATALFRGSEIVAYYTPEIPIGFGPFKFKGLPGLILEVFNVDTNGQKYHWKAKKIVYPYETETDLTFNTKKHNDQIVTYRSIIEDFDKKMMLFNQKMITNNPRGSATKSGKIERISIEKKYEWEEE